MLRVRKTDVTVGLTSLCLLSACATATRPPAAPAPLATFDFTPQHCGAASGNRLTLAIVAPAWQALSPAKATTLRGGDIIPLQAQFTRALRDNFLELVTCRGFVTRGPFGTFDEMVFPDRDGSNLLLESVVDANVQYTDVQKMAYCQGGLRAMMCTADAISSSAPSEFTVRGTLVFSGRVTLSLKEPVTNTRMWAKSIELGNTSVPFQGTSVYSGALTSNLNIRRDVGLLIALTPKMEEIHRVVLTTADKYLDPSEVRLGPRKQLKSGNAARSASRDSNQRLRRAPDRAGRKRDAHRAASRRGSFHEFRRQPRARQGADTDSPGGRRAAQIRNPVHGRRGEALLAVCTARTRTFAITRHMQSQCTSNQNVIANYISSSSSVRKVARADRSPVGPPEWMPTTILRGESIADDGYSECQ